MKKVLPPTYYWHNLCNLNKLVANAQCPFRLPFILFSILSSIIMWWYPIAQEKGWNRLRQIMLAVKLSFFRIRVYCSIISSCFKMSDFLSLYVQYNVPKITWISAQNPSLSRPERMHNSIYQAFVNICIMYVYLAFRNLLFRSEVIYCLLFSPGESLLPLV